MIPMHVAYVLPYKLQNAIIIYKDNMCLETVKTQLQFVLITKWYHYENMPMQYIEIFFTHKN